MTAEHKHRSDDNCMPSSAAEKDTMYLSIMKHQFCPESPVPVSIKRIFISKGQEFQAIFLQLFRITCPMTWSTSCLQ